MSELIVDTSTKELWSEKYRNIDRLERASTFFMLCSWILLLLALLAGAALMSGSKSTVITVGGQVVYGLGGLISLAVVGVFGVVSLRAIAHWLHSTAIILEEQLKTREQLDRQERMLKAIGKAMNLHAKDTDELRPVQPIKSVR